MERLFDSRWHERAVLSDGRKIELRLLRPEDAPLLAEGFEKLSPESRYRRFHGTRGNLTPDELRYLAEIDGENHFALGALDARTGEGLGVARFVRLPREPRIAEPAVTVIDSAQKKGLGSLLLRQLADAARERGIESFRCFVLSSNEPMRDLLQRLDLPAPTTEAGVLRFDLPLEKLTAAAPAWQRGHPVHDLLVAGATGAFLVADAVEHVRHWIAQRGAKDAPQSGSTRSSSWVTDSSAVLLTDLYQLTMAQAYFAGGQAREAVFELFVRKLPPRRNYLVACGLEDALHFLENLRFGPEAIAALSRDARFTAGFLERLSGLRFTGDVDAVPEGTPVFAGEPLLQLIAPLPEAQLAETFLLNQIVFQTTIASKAARVVAAAQGRSVIDFGLRRMHGADAGMKAARASFIAGVDGTSNVLAAAVYGIPPSGTMAHSYVQAHGSELEAFREFAAVYPETVLLVDTYDTLAGVRNAIRLARELGPAFRVRALRLDSGDLFALSVQARQMLDEAGLAGVGLFASGGLDEDVIAGLLARGAPIGGFGVGTAMGVSSDAPSLDAAYKLVQYDGKGRMKLSTGKATVPGRKQIFRTEDRDVVALYGETLPGRPLLEPVMRGGRRTGAVSLAQARAHAKEECSRLPAHLRALDPAKPPYRVELSEALAAERDRVRRSIS